MTSSASRHAPDCWDTTPTLSLPGNILDISVDIPPTAAPTLWFVIVAPLYAPLCAPAALSLQCNKLLTAAILAHKAYPFILHGNPCSNPCSAKLYSGSIRTRLNSHCRTSRLTCKSCPI